MKKIWQKIKVLFKKRPTKLIALGVVLAILLVIMALSKQSGQELTRTLLPQLKLQKKVDISQFGIDIAKVNVWAPIIPQVDGYDKEVYLKAIENGVAQFKDTKNPDELGNLFIFGHSKYYHDKPGDYKEIFKDLNQLKAKDEFNIYYKGEKIVYAVTESKKVDQYDWSILDPTADDPKDKTITLMTCWPPGTTDARWVVFATQK